MGDPELKGERCLLRRWQKPDRGSLVRYANSRKIWINLRDRFPHPYTEADAEQWISESLAEATPTRFAIVANGQAIGGIGLELNNDVFARSAEIGYWLGEPFWGRGIATDAVRTFTGYGFSAFDLCRIYAGVFEWNPASARVLERAGYVCEGRLRKSVTKDGRTIDQWLYAIVQ